MTTIPGIRREFCTLILKVIERQKIQGRRQPKKSAIFQSVTSRLALGAFEVKSALVLI